MAKRYYQRILYKTDIEYLKLAALIDRLTFRSYVLDMNGESYRLKATMKDKS